MLLLHSMQQAVKTKSMNVPNWNSTSMLQTNISKHQLRLELSHFQLCVCVNWLKPTPKGYCDVSAKESAGRLEGN